MTPMRDDRPMEYSWRSGWRLMLRPSGCRVTVLPAQQLALPLPLEVQPAPRLTFWEQVRAWLYEDILFPPRTPY